MQKKIVTAIIILTLCLGSYAMAAKVDGLVLYFSFDEGAGGTVNDTSGNNNNGKIIKGTKWVAGKFGKGLEFGGADSVEVVNSKSLEFIDEISLMLWIKPALDGTEWQGLITKGPDGGESFEFLLNKAGHFHTGWKFAGGRICPNRGAGGAVAKGEWQHAAITYKPGEWLCYLNGEVLDKQVANDKLVNLEDPLILGDEKGMSRFYTGIMD
ncbi:TPA: LamG domain-containing protein, partial [bacterium]|nr:LamG domain-containing protein [bacterium]